MLFYMIIAILALSSAEDCKSKCPLIFNKERICGSDGKFYDNLCFLDCAKKNDSSLELSYYSKCQRTNQLLVLGDMKGSCFCSFEENLVCASDNRTYVNLCILSCTNRRRIFALARPLYLGICKNNLHEVYWQKPFYCKCGMHYTPVCGSDGKTYPTECLLSCKKKIKTSLYKAYNGACDPPKRRDIVCKCKIDDRLYCASDGKIYKGECSVLCTGKGLTIESFSSCR